jgi:hypothetical protein
MTSPPPSPSPLEGEGWVGVKGFFAFVLVRTGELLMTSEYKVLNYR